MSFLNNKEFELQKLLARVEYTKFNKSKFKDDQANELLAKVDASNITKMEEEKAKRYIASTFLVDELVEDYTVFNSNAAIITINAGLDTRKTRIDRKNTTWYNLDTEEMKVYKESLGYDNVYSNDLLDPAWVDNINKSCPSVLIIFEDYFMYEDKNKVKEILDFLCKKFENVTFIIETVNNKLLKKFNQSYGYKTSHKLKDLLCNDDIVYVKKRSSYRGLEKLYWYKILTEFLGSNYSTVFMLHKN